MDLVTILTLVLSNLDTIAQWVPWIGVPYSAGKALLFGGAWDVVLINACYTVLLSWGVLYTLGPTLVRYTHSDWDDKALPRVLAALNTVFLLMVKWGTLRGGKAGEKMVAIAKARDRAKGIIDGVKKDTGLR